MSKGFWFWFILLLGISLRLYGLYNPLLDNHGWRQADTASMAVNLLKSGFLPPFPQLNYDGPPPNYAELEFPIVPMLIAGAWKLFGQSDILARLIAVAFSAGIFVLIYLLTKELYDSNSGLLAMVFYALNPLALYYGRTVMPEGAMLFFSIACLYFLVRWLKRDTQGDLVLCALSFALAVLAKLPAALIGVPILTTALAKYGRSLVRQRVFWIFLLIGLLPPALYYYAVHLAAKAKYVSGIAQSQLHWSAVEISYLQKMLKYKLTYPLILTALPALFLRRAKAGNHLLYAWFAILMVYTLTIGSRIQLEYYLYPVVPLLCVLAGATLGRFWGEAPGVISGLLIFLLCANQIPKALENYYQFNNTYLTQAKVIEEYTRPGELIVLDGEPPMTFYYSDRQGWRLWEEHQLPHELEALRSKGAALFVIMPGSSLRPELKEYLDSRYSFIAAGNFYDLRELKS